MLVRAIVYPRGPGVDLNDRERAGLPAAIKANLAVKMPNAPSIWGAICPNSREPVYKVILKLWGSRTDNTVDIQRLDNQSQCLLNRCLPRETGIEAMPLTRLQRANRGSSIGLPPLDIIVKIDDD